MGSFSHRPLLHERAVEQALEAMRSGSMLRDHVLHSFLNVQMRLRAPHSLAGPAALQIAVYDFLSTTILTMLAHLRALHDLAVPDPACLEHAISLDFTRNNSELEAMSALYARYVCVDRVWSTSDLVAMTGQPERTFRRRLQLGYTRLTHELIRLEQAARQHHHMARLRLALPYDRLPEYVGMETLLPTARHIALFADPPRHVLLHGPSGIGKTALALALAHALVNDQQVDDVLWVSFEGQSVSSENVIADIVAQLALRMFDDNPSPVQVLRAYLVTHTVLIVLDQVEGILDGIEQILAVLSAAIVVITSRHDLPPHIWHARINVPELDRAQAFALLERATANDASLQAQVLSQFDALWAAVGGNPLALKIALSSARYMALADFPVNTELHARYDSLWGRLTETEQRTLLLVRVFHPDGISSQACCGLCAGYSPEVIHAALASLSRASLLEIHLDRGILVYRLHSVMASYLLQHILSDQAGADFAFICAVVDQCVGQVLTQPDASLAVRLLEFARQVHMPLSSRWQMAHAFAGQIMGAGLWQSWLTELRAFSVDMLSLEQRLWHDYMLGLALRWTGRLAESARVLDRLLEADPDQAAALVELSVVRRYQGDWVAAQRVARAAFEVFLRRDDLAGVDRCIHELAQIALDTQDAEHTLAWLSRLSMWDARAWSIASQAYLILAQVDEAIAAAHQSLNLLPLIHPHRGRCMVVVANAYTAQMDLSRAIDYLTSALDLLAQGRDVLGYARASSNFAAVLLHQPAQERTVGLAETRALLTKALEVQQHSGDELGMAVTQQNLALLADEERWVGS